MGKAKNLKKIRRIAMQLPALKRKSSQAELVKGSELIAEGISEVEGKTVHSEGFYRRTKGIAVDVNHGRALKKAYAKYGVSGVKSYINAVDEFVNKNEPSNKTQINEHTT